MSVMPFRTVKLTFPGAKTVVFPIRSARSGTDLELRAAGAAAAEDADTVNL